ncbi:pilin protein [Anaerovibrio slackiae]|uniref:pilin protein n=1 Tax=Anaerovibrio slackiae TaxID=2652309 RepID=UPI003F140C8C
MFTILTHLKNRYLSQKAQGIVEYALILAFVVVLAVVLSSDGGLGGAISSIFGTTANKLNSAASSAAK